MIFMYEGQILKFDNISWNPFYFGDFVVVTGINDKEYFTIRWFDKGGSLPYSVLKHSVSRYKKGFLEI